MLITNRADIDRPAITQARDIIPELMPGITHRKRLTPLQLQCPIDKLQQMLTPELLLIDPKLLRYCSIGVDQKGFPQRCRLDSGITEFRESQIGVGQFYFIEFHRNDTTRPNFDHT